VFGKVIDALIERVSSDGPSLKSLERADPLFLWILFFGHLGTGVVRRIVDERNLSSHLSEIATGIASSGRKRKTASPNGRAAQAVRAVHQFSQRQHPNCRTDYLLGRAVIRSRHRPANFSGGLLDDYTPPRANRPLYTRKSQFSAKRVS